jgi:hypothetical protein
MEGTRGRGGYKGSRVAESHERTAAPPASRHPRFPAYNESNKRNEPNKRNKPNEPDQQNNTGISSPSEMMRTFESVI